MPALALVYTWHTVFFTRDSIYAIARICYRPSVRPSVRRVYHRKTVEVRIIKFSPYNSPIPLVFREHVSSRNSGGSPRAGALNEGGVCKIGDFRTLGCHISETVQDRTKVAIDH